MSKTKTARVETSVPPAALPPFIAWSGRGMRLPADVQQEVWAAWQPFTGISGLIVLLQRHPAPFAIVDEDAAEGATEPYVHAASAMLDLARMGGFARCRNGIWTKAEDEPVEKPRVATNRKKRGKGTPGPELLPNSDTMTPERAAKGRPEVAKVSVNVDGRLEIAKVQRDKDCDWVTDALAMDKLTKAQAAAADKFATEAYVAYGSGARSNIDMSVRGGEGDGARKAQASTELHRVMKECERVYGHGEGQGMHFLLVGVLYRGEATGKRRATYVKWQNIIKALDCAVDVWRIPKGG